jgi:hypothetical protein
MLLEVLQLLVLPLHSIQVQVFVSSLVLLVALVVVLVVVVVVVVVVLVVHLQDKQHYDYILKFFELIVYDILDIQQVLQFLLFYL